MTNTKWMIGAALAASLVLGGCQRPQGYAVTERDLEQQAGRSASEDATTGEAGTGSGTGEAEPGTSVTPSVPSPSGPTDTNVPPSRTPRPENVPAPERPSMPTPRITPAGTGGWMEAKLSPGEVGQKMDRALQSLKGLEAGYDVELENGEVVGTASGRIRVVDPTRYQVEYLVLADPTLSRRVLADGRQKKVFSREGWSRPQSLRGGTQRSGRELVEQFPDRFSQWVIEPLTSGQPVWSSLLPELEREGFTVEVEARQMVVNGQMRPFLRVVAERSGGSPGLQRLELRLDGVRYVPLTIRMIGQDAQQRPLKADWRARWLFNQKVNLDDSP